MSQVSNNQSWLDNIFGDDSFLGDGFDKLSSFGERMTALILSKRDEEAPPLQTPTPLQNLFGESAPSTSQLVLYGASAVILGAALYFAFKK